MHILSHRTLIFRIGELERRSGLDTIERVGGNQEDNPTALDRLIQRSVSTSIDFKAQARLGNWSCYGFRAAYEASLNT